jgi:hypothetical protein
MKKLFTLAVTMLLAGALSFAQTGSTDKPAGTTKTTDASSGKKGKAKSKKGSAKKGKKKSGSSAPATPPSPK